MILGFDELGIGFNIYIIIGQLLINKVINNLP
jgi:hypothetical protein